MSRLAAGLVASLLGGLALAPAAQADLLAAYDRYVQGSGFDIRLVNATTGASVSVPSGVNTSADEIHPALTPNGRFLVFTRMTLQPQPDGDVVPPGDRQLLMVDRQTGQIRNPFNNVNDPATGATIVKPTSGQPILAAGNRYDSSEGSGQRLVVAGPFFPDGLNPSPFLPPPPPEFLALGTHGSDATGVDPPASGGFVDTIHAAVTLRDGARLKVTNRLRFTPTASLSQVATMHLRDFEGSGASLDITSGQPRHPTPRAGDGHIALDRFVGSGGEQSIQTIQFPGDGNSSLAPSPINTTSNAEGMPAWSPEGDKLAFIRTSGQGGTTSSKRELLVYDTTPGVQTIMNAGVNLGGEDAPTAQLRGFHRTWGGLALATIAGGAAVNCFKGCQNALTGVGPSAASPAPLKPSLSASAVGGGTGVGILVARQVGFRRLFGRRVPRVRILGRVPLGRASRRRPTFRWTGRVRGRRLRPGRYLLTFRVLNRRKRVLDVSRSISFRLTRTGRIARVRALR